MSFIIPVLHSFFPSHASEQFNYLFFSFSGFLAFGPRSQINDVDEVEETHFANGVYFPMSRTLHEIPWAGHDVDKEGNEQTGDY